MKARLLFADRDPNYPDPSDVDDDLIRDLGLAPLLDAMASGDRYLRQIAHRILLSDPPDPAEIRYRQEILDDCLRLPDAIRELYELAVTATEAKRRVRTWILGDYPSAILYRAVSILRDLTEHLTHLHDFEITHHDDFRSAGLRILLATVEHDLADPYLKEVRQHLRQLEFTGGAILTASLAPGCTGTGYSLRKPVPSPWWTMLTTPWGPGRGYTYRLPPRDENGGRTLSRIRDHGVNTVADATAQSAEHVLDFFIRLRLELGFYIACLNLHDALISRGVPTCLPVTEPTADLGLGVRGLVDAGLALRTRGQLVANDLDADGKTLIVLTGPNQGGKSTLLRALGVAQLMLDSGMFVAATSYRGSTSRGVLTHYRREEDANLEHGKLDDELARMSRLADRVRPGTVVLLDESFASTNEREGSEIASGIVDSLLDAGIRVYYVTHLYALAQGLAQQRESRHHFLRAQRESDGQRTFRLVPGLPESTSYANDLFREVFPDPVRS